MTYFPKNAQRFQKVVCFPCYYYLSEPRKLVVGKRVIYLDPLNLYDPILANYLMNLPFDLMTCFPKTQQKIN